MHRHSLGKLILCAGLFFTLADCGSHSESPSTQQENAILDGTGFSTPVTYTAEFSDIFAFNGGFTGDTNVNAISALVKTGHIQIAASSSPPYWTYSVVIGSLNGNKIEVPLAHREIKSRSNEKAWTEGSVSYYAEDVNYDLVLEPPFAQAFNMKSLQKTFRVVMKNDPADGKWTLADRGNTFDPNDAQDLSTGVLNLGKDREPFVSAIQKATHEAADSIANQLKSQGVLEKGPGAILMSKQAHLAFMPIAGNFNGHQTGELAQLCHNYQNLLPSYHNWHWATRNDLSHIMNSQGAIIETPDHRFWGDLTGSGLLQIEANSFGDNNGWYTLEQLSGRPPTNFYWLSKLQINDAGIGTFGQDTASGNDPSHSAIGSSFPVRLICVADL